MNSKKLITLLVLTTMLLSIIPVVHADVDLQTANPAEGRKGKTIVVKGIGVPAGYEVELYWDDVTMAWNGVKGKINSTTADAGGDWEVWFDVPEAPIGIHYLWVKAPASGQTDREPFDVLSKVSLSASSGLAAEKVTADFYGYAKNKEMSTLFVADDDIVSWITAPVSGASLGTITAGETEYDGTITNVPIANGTITIYINAVAAFTDDGAGNLDVQGNNYGNGQATYTSGDGTTTSTNAITVTAPSLTADFSAALYDAAGTSELVAPIASTGNDATADTVVLTYTYADSTSYMVKITLADEGGSYTLADDGTPAGSGGPVTVVTVDFAGDGKINYVTGDWEFEVTAGAFAGDAITIDYSYFSQGADNTYILSTTGTTNDLGTMVSKRVTVPSATPEAYYIAGYDGKANCAVKKFTIGSVIEVDKDEVESGDVVNVEGRGFTAATPAATISECALYRDGVGFIADAVILDDETTMRTDGTFDIQVVIPDGPKKDDDYYLKITDSSAETAQVDLELTALSYIEVDPEYGPQGSRCSISGMNFPRIKGETILVELHDAVGWVADIDDYETNSDGTFEGEFRIPTQPDGEYTIVAYAEYDDTPLVLYNIEADADFRIGTILVLLSDDDGPTGMKVILTGSGFTDNGEWNASFGDIELFDTRGVTANGLLDDGGTPVFYVPQVSPGEYDIIVWDETAEINIFVPFEVTATTTLEFSTSEMPTGFNVSIYGENWIRDPTSTFTFTLFNDTDDWDVEGDILQHGGTKTATTFVRPDEDGVIEAWWEVYQTGGDELDKGVYYMNITDDTEDYSIQLTFTVGDEHVVAQPRKATFRISETVSFVLQHSFGNRVPVEGGDIRVYDPDGSLYWEGDELLTWTKVEMYYTAPISSQTAGKNPMILLDDAPLGTWTYKWREDDGDTILAGTFNVEAAAADILGEQIEDLNSAIDDLTSDISSVTDAVAGVQSNVNSAIQAANAAVDAANAAVEAVNAVAAQAGDAATAAQNAAEAATDAKNAASGLTTLVYGAIGASPVAALAAIVSLMQISRRIAG